jgi:hypothetical protein
MSTSPHSSKGVTIAGINPENIVGAAHTLRRPRTSYNPLGEAFSVGREAILLHGG